MVHSAADDAWPVLSEQAQDLFRRGAEEALHPRPEWVEELQGAVLGSARVRAIAEDPVLAEGTRRANLATLLHWAASNVQHPGRRVPPVVGPEVLETARDLVRRGLDESGLDAYRTGQSVAWRRWMEICFALTSDAGLLRELLDVSSLSISAFIDDTIVAVSERMAAERAELTSGTNAERRATVALLLQGAPIRRARAEAQLGYALTGPHTAVVVWGRSGTGSAALEASAEAVVRAAGASRRLTVVASADALWIWLPVATSPEAGPLQEALTAHPDVRVAVGRPGHDLDGFRRSHLEALTTQQVLARLTSPQQLAGYQDVHLVTLVTADARAADEFVEETLGDLLHADQETQAAVLTWVREQCNASRAAARLYTHRNTLLRRLARAGDLLPRPLEDDLVSVAVALEVLRWRGTSRPS